jgi:hypothetical protein
MTFLNCGSTDDTTRSVDIVKNVGPQCRLKTDEQAAVTGRPILTRIRRPSCPGRAQSIARGGPMLLLMVQAAT